jgi:hypothetical protein
MTDMNAQDHVKAAQSYIRRRENGGLGTPGGPWTDLAYLHLRTAEVLGQLAPAVEVVDPITQAIIWKEPLGLCPTCGASDKHSDLTRTQWLAHHEEYYQGSRDHGADKSAANDWADGRTEQRFGPEPMPPDPRDGTNR